PSFKCSKYKLGNAEQENRIGKPFLEEKVFYDMLERNKLYFKPKQKNENELPNIDDTIDNIRMLLARIPIEALADSEKSVIDDLIKRKKYQNAIEILNKTAESKDFEKFNLKPRIERITKKITILINLEKTNNET
ncbi:MAG: hypothetical protein ACI4PF_02135, partial [Christensenellales bacterium]